MLANFFNQLKKGLILLFLTAFFSLSSYYILFKHITSEGKAQGVLFKVTKRKKLFFIHTWEGTLNFSGGKILNFSIKDPSVADELFKYEGKEIVIFYENPIIYFPHNYNELVYDWRPVPEEEHKKNDKISLCFIFYTLKKNEGLFYQVKDFLFKENTYIKNILQDCGLDLTE